MSEKEPLDNVVLVCSKCRGREWEIRGDCILECVLCENTMDMAELVQQHQHGTGHWMNTLN